MDDKAYTVTLGELQQLADMQRLRNEVAAARAMRDMIRMHDQRVLGAIDAMATEVFDKIRKDNEEAGI